MKKGFGELVVGNIIGSNIANIALIFGVGAIINPIVVTSLSINFLIPAMLLFSLVLILFLRYGWKLNRVEGASLLAAYVLFIVFMFLRG